MRITVDTSGATPAQLIRAATHRLRHANRAVGRDVAKAGSKAIRKGAPRMMGRKLGVKTQTKPSLDGCDVSFRAKPAGPWAIVESGASAHMIRPRRDRALALAGRFVMTVNHPGTTGAKAWTKAADRLAAAIDPVVEDVYDEAFNG